MIFNFCPSFRKRLVKCSDFPVGSPYVARNFSISRHTYSSHSLTVFPIYSVYSDSFVLFGFHSSCFPGLRRHISALHHAERNALFLIAVNKRAERDGKRIFGPTCPTGPVVLPCAVDQPRDQPLILLLAVIFPVRFSVAHEKAPVVFTQSL